MAERWVSTKAGAHLAGRRKVNTAPEVLLRQAVHAAGGRFRLHRQIAKGCTPDFVLPSHHVAVFVDGYFWPPHEAARLQGFGRTLSFTGQRDSASYKQVGNGVAVGAAWHVFRTHVESDASDLPRPLVRAVLNVPLNPTGNALATEAMIHEATSAGVTQTVAS